MSDDKSRLLGLVSRVDRSAEPFGTGLIHPHAQTCITTSCDQLSNDADISNGFDANYDTPKIQADSKPRRKPSSNWGDTEAVAEGEHEVDVADGDLVPRAFPGDFQQHGTKEMAYPVKHESQPDLLTPLVINGKTFGGDHQLDPLSKKSGDGLMTLIRLHIIPTMPCRIVINVTGKRMQDKATVPLAKRVNLLGHVAHRISLDIFHHCIVDISITDLTEDTLPAALKHPGLDASHLQDKVMLTFTAVSKSIKPIGLAIEAMENSTLQRLMQSCADHIKDSISSNDKVTFHVMAKRAQTSILNLFKAKVEADKAMNPMRAWTRNILRADTLNMNNLHFPQDRPPVPGLGLVYGRCSRFEDSLQMNVVHAYSEQEKNLYEITKLQLLVNLKWECVLYPVPLSNFRSTKLDNDLPNVYFAFVVWGPDKNNLQKLKPGTEFSARFESFLVPDPPAYEGKDQKPERGVGASINKEIDFHKHESDEDDGEVIFSAGKSQPEGRSEKALQAQDMAKLQTMNCVVVENSAGIPGNILTVIMDVPIDFRYRGPFERHVDTIFPVGKMRSNNSEMFVADMLAAPKHPFRMTIKHSTQAYKDTIRNLSNFCSVQDDLVKDSARHHHGQYFQRFDDSTPYQSIDYRHVFAPDDFDQRLKGLDEISCAMVQRWLSGQIHHYVVPINGYVGCRKTWLSIFLAVTPLNKDRSFRTLLIQDTNAGANNLALEALAEITRQGLSDIEITRVGSLNVEMKKMYNARIPKATLLHLKDMDDDVIAFLSEAYVYRKAAEAEAFKRKGDTRFDARCSNLYLHERMLVKLENLRSTRAKYADLHRMIEELRDTTHHGVDMNVFKAILKSLMRETIAASHILITTPAQAMKTAFQEAVGELTFLVLDEDSKRPSAVALAVCGGLGYHVLIINGDLKQERVFFQEDTRFWSQFKNTSTMTLLSRCIENNVPNPILLVAQFRMHMPAHVKLISKLFYNDFLFDALHNQALPPQVLFVRDVFKALFNIDNNVVVVGIKNSKHNIEHGSTSLTNKAHLIVAKKVFDKTAQMLETTTHVFDKSHFSAAFLSYYRAQVDGFKAILDENSDLRVASYTCEEIRSVSTDMAIVCTTASKLTKWVGNQPRSLLMLSRARYGQITLVSSKALIPATYENEYTKKKLTGENLLRKPATAITCAQVELAKKHGFFCSVGKSFCKTNKISS